MRSSDAYRPQRRTTCAPQGEAAAFGRRRAAAAGTPSSGRRGTSCREVRRRPSRRRTGRGAPTSRSPAGGCRSAGRGRMPRLRRSCNRERARWARYWASWWLASTTSLGRVASVGVDGDLGAEPGVVGDVGIGGDPVMHVGSQVRRGRCAAASSSWCAPPPAEGPPVDRARRGRGTRRRQGVRASSRYTSFQCSRLTGAYGLGSNGSSRKAAYSGSVISVLTPMAGSAAPSDGEVGERRQWRVVLPQGVRRGEDRGTVRRAPAMSASSGGARDDRRRLVDARPGERECVAADRERFGDVDVVAGDVEVDDCAVGQRQAGVVDPAPTARCAPRCRRRSPVPAGFRRRRRRRRPRAPRRRVAATPDRRRGSCPDRPSRTSRRRALPPGVAGASRSPSPARCSPIRRA